MNRKPFIFLLLISLLLLLVTPLNSHGEVTTVETVLDGRTAFRWGRDFLVWAVHYSGDLVDPWVRANTGGEGDPTGKMAEEFRASLKMDGFIPVLLSLHSYTERALQLKPFSERIFLEKPDGERLPPTSYDSIFDSPITGLVQGLVFFPLVDGPFELVLLPDQGKELTFEFPEDHDNRLKREAAKEEKNRLNASSAVDAQKIRLQAEETRRKELEENRKQWEREKADLLKQIENLSSQKQLLRQRLDETLTELKTPRKSLFTDNRHEKFLSEPEQTVKKKADQPLAPGFSRNQIIQLFLTAWKKGDAEDMLTFLSPAFRKEIETAEDLETLLKNKALPGKLPDDARVEDDGQGNLARVIFAQKMLVVRILRSAKLTLTKFSNGWCISSFQ